MENIYGQLFKNIGIFQNTPKNTAGGTIFPIPVTGREQFMPTPFPKAQVLPKPGPYPRFFRQGDKT
jgi:hypothetical protein